MCIVISLASATQLKFYLKYAIKYEWRKQDHKQDVDLVLRMSKGSIYDIVKCGP